MPDTKITALAAITTVDPAADVLPIVDISDTSMAASGTTKKITSNQILGAGGTATLASATISGDLTVDTSTLKVDSANDRVGVGTASPTNKLSVTVTPPTADTDGLIINGPSSRQIIAGITGATYSYAGVGANQNLIYSGSGQLNILGDNQNVRIGTSASSYVTLDTSANFNVGGGNVVMATSGKGIDFSATASGSGTMTSELLNDYEEGTFTPTVGDASSGGNQATTATAVGRYTKIGRLVTVQWEVTDINTTGLTAGNALYIRGLPFASSSATTQFGTPAVSGVTFSGYLTAGVFSGSSFPIYSSSSGGSLADIKVSAVASGTADIWGTLTYIV